MNYLVNKFDFILEKNEDIIDEFFKDFFSKKFKKMLMKYPVNEDNTTFLENIVFNISNSIVLYKKQKLQDYPKCAYIGVFGQQCRSSTGHFCNEIF